MKKLLLLVVTIALVLSSCVPMAQLAKVEQEKEVALAEVERIRQANRNMNVANTELESKIEVLERRISRVEKEVLDSKRALNATKSEYQQLETRYNNLLKLQSDLASGTDRDAAKILKELQALQQSLMEKEDRLGKLENSLDTKRKNLELLQAEYNEQNSRLVELERVLSQKDSVMNGLRAKVAEALFAFDADELTVEMRNGKVYVSLEEKLLFGSGSYAVGAKGQEALKKLAGVLAQNPDIQVLIEGHTDDVPINSTSQLMIDNWDLSVKRATSIVRILLSQPGLDPTRLTAAGRGEFLPIASNETKEGKQKNRRTEIVLTPRLDELFNLIGN